MKKLAYIKLNRPTPLPATERCPGQPGMALEFFTLATRVVFGHGGDHASYVRSA